MSRRDEGWGCVLLPLALAGAIVALRWCGPEEADAQERPVSAADQRDLARCLVAEADAHTADFAPILSVLSARAARVGSTPAAVARRYCAALRAAHPSRRQALVLALPGGPGAREYARAWTAATEAVASFRGPTCPATHFGSRADGHPRGWVAIDCGPTLNLFYREPDRRTGSVPAAVARGRR